MGNDNQGNLLPDIIRERKLLPFEVKIKIINNVFYNCILFIVMMLLTLVINVAFNRFSIRYFESYVNAFQILCAISSVTILEIAYRKNNGILGLYGVEFLVYSIALLFVPYMYLSKGNLEFLRTVILVFVAYYFIKSLITLIYLRNKYLKDNISDVKEIVKEEKESYLDEESTKTLKLQKAEEELRKKAKAEKLKNKKDIAKTGGDKNDK